MSERNYWLSGFCETCRKVIAKPGWRGGAVMTHGPRGGHKWEPRPSTAADSSEAPGRDAVERFRAALG